MIKSSLKEKEKKIKSERDEDKSKQNKHENNPKLPHKFEHVLTIESTKRWTRWKWKQTKQEMNWKSRIRTLTGWRPKNGRRTVKNGEKYSRICSWKRLGRVTEAPQLGFSSQKHVFSPKTVEMHSIGVRNPWNSVSSPYL